MSQKEERILVIGLPETGKSSFIQALDEVVRHCKSDAELASFRLADDRTYLQQDKAAFRAGKKLNRNPRPSDNTSVQMHLVHASTGSRLTIQLPDKRGEIFRDQFLNREWDPEFRDSLAHTTGALLFIRADETPTNDERLGVLAKSAPQPHGPVHWDLKESSIQVQVVDILQFIFERGSPPRPLKMAVMLSAWDTVGAPGDVRPKTPEKFLEREWALLAQYLRANPELVEFRVYGISAYGGTPDALGDLKLKAPHERVVLVDGSETSRDLSRPLRWLLQLE